MRRAAQRERVDAACDFPFSQAAPEIALDAGGRLVALLGGLGEQLHDDSRQRGRDVRQIVEWRRMPGDVAMNPFQGIGRRERQTPVSIWYSVTPSEYRSLRGSIDRFIRPVCSGDM